MDCSKNRLSSGVDDPDMEVGSVRARPRDVFGISVLLTLLLAILLAMWTVGFEDPHGLSHATPVRAADVPSLEPLYGAVQTPWRSVDWSPDVRQIALTGEADGVTIVEAATGQVAAHWKVPAYTNVIRWSPDGSHLAVGGWTGIVGPGWVYVYTAEGFLERSWEAHSREVGGLAWAPNGTWLATAANARFAIWEAGPESSSGACSTRPSGARPRTGHRMATTSRSMRSAGRPSTTPSRAGPSSSARPRKRWMSEHPRGPTRETASHPRT